MAWRTACPWAAVGLLCVGAQSDAVRVREWGAALAASVAPGATAHEEHTEKSAKPNLYSSACPMGPCVSTGKGVLWENPKSTPLNSCAPLGPRMAAVCWPVVGGTKLGPGSRLLPLGPASTTSPSLGPLGDSGVLGLGGVGACQQGDGGVIRVVVPL